MLLSAEFKRICSVGTDDDHRVVLESISDGVDCEHDYINATYIDVRGLGIRLTLKKKNRNS